MKTFEMNEKELKSLINLINQYHQYTCYEYCSTPDLSEGENGNGFIIAFAEKSTGKCVEELDCIYHDDEFICSHEKCWTKKQRKVCKYEKEELND